MVVTVTGKENLPSRWANPAPAAPPDTPTKTALSSQPATPEPRGNSPKRTPKHTSHPRPPRRPSNDLRDRLSLPPRSEDSAQASQPPTNSSPQKTPRRRNRNRNKRPQSAPEAATNQTQDGDWGFEVPEDYDWADEA